MCSEFGCLFRALLASVLIAKHHSWHLLRPSSRSKYCSPTRSSYQTGRFPIHVNVLNLDMSVHNPADPVSGFAGVPRNMTGIAEKLASAGYQTHFAGSEVLRSAESHRRPDSAPRST